MPSRGFGLASGQAATANKHCKPTDFLLNLVVGADSDSSDRDWTRIVAE
jgi:hypothetical protein